MTEEKREKAVKLLDKILDMIEDKEDIDEIEPDDYISRKELLAEIDKERDWLLNHNMYAAEHIVVHHARRIIEDMRGAG